MGVRAAALAMLLWESGVRPGSRVAVGRICKGILIFSHELQSKVIKERRLMHEVALPSLARFAHHAIQPLEPDVGYPGRRPLETLGFVIDGPAERQVELDPGEPIAVLEDELLLA